MYAKFSAPTEKKFCIKFIEKYLVVSAEKPFVFQELIQPCFLSNFSIFRSDVKKSEEVVEVAEGGDKKVVGWRDRSHWCWDKIKCFLLAFNHVIFQVQFEVNIDIEISVGGTEDLSECTYFIF